MLDWTQTPLSPSYPKLIIMFDQFVQIDCYNTAGYQKKVFEMIYS